MANLEGEKNLKGKVAFYGLAGLALAATLVSSKDAQAGGPQGGGAWLGVTGRNSGLTMTLECAYPDEIPPWLGSTNLLRLSVDASGFDNSWNVDYRESLKYWLQVSEYRKKYGLSTWTSTINNLSSVYSGEFLSIRPLTGPGVNSQQVEWSFLLKPRTNYHVELLFAPYTEGQPTPIATYAPITLMYPYDCDATPTPTATATRTATLTPTRTATSTATLTSTSTRTPTSTATMTRTATLTPEEPKDVSSDNPDTPVPTLTKTPRPTPTATPTTTSTATEAKVTPSATSTPEPILDSEVKAMAQALEQIDTPRRSINPFRTLVRRLRTR